MSSFYWSTDVSNTINYFLFCFCSIVRSQQFTSYAKAVVMLGAKEIVQELEHLPYSVPAPLYLVLGLMSSVLSPGSELYDYFWQESG